MPILFPPCVLISRLRPPAASVFEQILWWMEIATEAFILLRSINARLYGKYLTFFIYLTAVLLIDLLRFSVLTLHPSVYAPFYWYTQFLHAGVGYAVILEIYKHTLNNSPGVARIARTFVWGVLGVVILKVTLNAVIRPVWSTATTSTELERDMRAVQALLLAGIIALLAYYVVPTGRNLRGIIFGYSAYIYSSVVSLAFGSLPGYGLRPGWRLVQPTVYLAALVVWCCTLWSYSPDPATETESKIDRDYKLIAEQTRRALSRARSFLKMGGEL